MSKEREVNGPGTVDELKDKALQAKAKYAQLLTRGYIVDRMAVENADPNMHYEWVLNEPYELHRKDALGFKITTGKAGPTYITNSVGDERKVVGDCVLMELPKEDYSAFCAAQAELAAARMGTKSGDGSFVDAPEDKQVRAGIRDVGLPTIDDPSKVATPTTRVVSGTEIVQSLSTK
jgi:hypothetical protein